MRGIVLTGLKDFIEENYSLSEWNTILKKTDNEDLLIMTAEYYSDDDALELIGCTAETVGLPLEKFVITFGKHLFSSLEKYYNFILEDILTYEQLLFSLDDVIHPHVKKIHQDAIVPSFKVNLAEGGWDLIYQSERKLCPLAIGLLFGAAEHFNTTIDIHHSHCMHNGEQECIINVTRQ